MNHPAPSSSTPSANAQPAPAASRVVVPYVDLASQHRPIKQELLDAVGQVIDTGQFVLGPAVEAFERQMAALCDVPFAIGVNSGTDALALALRALDIGQGDEVITAPNSFVASASAIALAGATPVFADVDDDLLLCPDRVAAAITPRTRAILPVHLTGRAADMTAITQLATAHNLHIIEDAAQAILAEHRGRRVGSWGTAGCFSLHPLKTLNACGDGGVITTHDEALANKLRLLRNLGLRSREQCVTWSSHSRLDSVQAAMLCVKLRYVERWTQTRIDHAAHYRQGLAALSQVRCPQPDPHGRSVYHTFVIQAQQRDALQSHLTSRGVQTAVHYPIPIHLQEAASPLGYKPGAFPVAEAQAMHILSLPIHPELTSAQLDHVIDAIHAFYRG